MWKLLFTALVMALGATAGADDQSQKASAPPLASAAPQQQRAAGPPHNARPELGERRLDGRGGYNWPPNDGFAGVQREETLPPGMIIDRYGQPGGSFFAPAGTPYEARALPYERGKMDYYRYRVTKPLAVLAGESAPWFDQPGGGIQYKTATPALKLLRKEALVEISQE